MRVLPKITDWTGFEEFFIPFYFLDWTAANLRLFSISFDACIDDLFVSSRIVEIVWWEAFLINLLFDDKLGTQCNKYSSFEVYLT